MLKLNSYLFFDFSTIGFSRAYLVQIYTKEIPKVLIIGRKWSYNSEGGLLLKEIQYLNEFFVPKIHHPPLKMKKFSGFFCPLLLFYLINNGLAGSEKVINFLFKKLKFVKLISSQKEKRRSISVVGVTTTQISHLLRI